MNKIRSIFLHFWIPKESVWHGSGERQIYKREKQKQAWQKSILLLKDRFSLCLVKISLSTKASHLHQTPTEALRELTLLTKLAFWYWQAPQNCTNEIQSRGPLTLWQHPKKLICQMSKTIFELKTILKTQNHPSSVIRFAQLLESAGKYSAGVLQPYRVCYIWN